MQGLKVTITLVLLALVAVFTFQNAAVMLPVHFLFWSKEISGALMLIFALIFGIIIGMLISFFNTHKKKKSDHKKL